MNNSLSINHSISSHNNILIDVWNRLKQKESVQNSKRHNKIEKLKKKNTAHKLKNNKILQYNLMFQIYLSDIEKQTGLKILPKQIKLIKNAILNNKFKKLSPSENAKHRAQYNKVRQDIIREWEEHTGMKWLKYDKPVYSKKGKIIRHVGDNYDVHHIIESCFGGFNVWWNAHPARFPDQHQQGIHRKGSPSNKIFG